MKDNKTFYAKHIPEWRAEYLMLLEQSKEINKRLADLKAVLIEVRKYPNLFDRQKFGKAKFVRGRPRTGGTKNCIQCGREFYLRPSFLKQKRYRYCSRQCYTDTGLHKIAAAKGGRKAGRWRKLGYYDYRRPSTSATS